MTADKVAAHYTHGSLLEAILAKLDEAGVAQGGLTARDLAPLDHLHTRGVVATDEMIERLQPQAGQTIIDIGCGIGGPARYIAAITEAKVTGIDLTPEFIAVASTLADMTGLGDAASFQVGDALNLPFDDASFDAIFLVTVFGEIAEREAFLREAARVLKPDGVLSITEHHPDPDFESAQAVVAGLQAHGFEPLQQLGWRWAYTLNAVPRRGG